MRSFADFFKGMRRRADMYMAHQAPASRGSCISRGPCWSSRETPIIWFLSSFLRALLVVRLVGAGVSLKPTTQDFPGRGGDIYLVEISQDMGRAQESPGLFLARGLCHRLEVVTVCGGERGTMVCVHGDLSQPVIVEPSDDPEQAEFTVWLDSEISGPRGLRRRRSRS